MIRNPRFELPADGLHAELPSILTRSGSCEAPAIMSAAIHAGHRSAQNPDQGEDAELAFKHDRIDAGRVAPTRRRVAAE